MSRRPRIGILTGGGDVPGLNSVIKSVTYRATDLGYEVLGIRRGWEGLTHHDPSVSLDPRYVIPLTRDSTRTIDRTGGTMLHTSRTSPRKFKQDRLPSFITADEAAKLTTDGQTYDLTPVVLESIERLGLDYLVPDRRRRHAQLRADAARQRRAAASRSPRRWTTTCRARSTASASRPPSPAPRS